MSEPEALLVFGDSLSDSGNAYDLSARVLKVPIPPDSAGYNGWFSNGLIQSAVTADLLGVPLQNYAVGGARAVGSRTVAQYLEQNGYYSPEIMLPNPDPLALATDGYLGGQLRRYLSDATTNPPAAGTVATIWIGANDYNALPPDASPELVGQTIAAVVGSIIAAAGAIALSGVGKVLIYNLPAPEFLPVPLPPAFGQVVDAHNAALAGEVARLQSEGINAEIVDMNGIGDEIVADPGTFGLNPAYLDQPMLLGIGSQPEWVPEIQNWSIDPNPVVADVDANRVAFKDFLHPSSAVHGVLGAFAAGSMTDNLVPLGSGNEVRFTGPLDDLVLGGAGNDRIFAQRGDDTVLAGLGDDIVLAGPGRDIVAGGAGDDHVHGGVGNDVVAGSDGDDVQSGGLGRDLMVDGLGHDRIAGGAHRDAFLYVEATQLGAASNAGNGGLLRGGWGIDTLYLAVGDATRAAVEAELRHGASSQRLESIDVATRSIERYVFVDPADPGSDIVTGARLEDADLWGIV